MTLSTLMVCLRVDRSNAQLLAVAADLAKRFGSHIVGIAARQVSAPSMRGAGPFEPTSHDMHKFAEQAAAAEREFYAVLSGFGALDWRMHMTLGPAYEHIADEARCADLVLASADAHERTLFSSGHAEVGDLLMRLGRPILTAPASANGFAFGQALACFKEVREARRALADALPVLRAMKRVMVVEIVEFGTLEAGRHRLSDVAAWLSRHGIVAAYDAIPANGAVGRQLARLAQELEADLIVAGAYGHSRLREWAFGGVTQDLLLRSDRCVLSSH